MFIVIYSFKVKPNQVQNFEKAWRDMTVLILKYVDSLGSRLHRQDDFNYIAYAQWPDKSTWENSDKKLLEISKDIRKTMNKSCEKIETLFELEVVEDLLEKNINDK
jgi:hypothetical protein